VDSENNLDNEGIKSKFQKSADEAYSHLPPFDPADYKDEIAGFDLTEQQQEEFLRTLWHIMAAFVDLGWGVSSLQNVLPGLAQLSENCEILEIEDNITAEDFNGAARDSAPEGEQPP